MGVVRLLLLGIKRVILDIGTSDNSPMRNSSIGGCGLLPLISSCFSFGIFPFVFIITFIIQPRPRWFYTIETSYLETRGSRQLVSQKLAMASATARALGHASLFMVVVKGMRPHVYTIWFHFFWLF